MPALSRRSIPSGLNNTGLMSDCDDTRQTQNICITCAQRWPDVFDVGPTLYTCYTNIFLFSVIDGPGEHKRKQHGDSAG